MTSFFRRSSLTIRPLAMKQTLSVLACAVILLVSARAMALIKVDLPIKGTAAAPGMVEKAPTIVVGTVTAVNPDNRVATVKIDKTLKGEGVGEQIRVQMVNPPELLQQVKVGQAAVVMTSTARAGLANIHLADTWLQAMRAGQTDIFRTMQVLPKGYLNAFPGRSAALADLLTQTLAGKYPLLDRMEPNYFGNARKLDKLPVAKPDGLLALDVNNDKALDVVATAGGKAQLFIAGESGYADVSANVGLAAAAATGATLAGGDVNGDGKTDLLLGSSVYLNDGTGKFSDAKAGLEAPAKCIKAALADADGDGKLDAIFVASDGQARVFRGDGAGKFAPLPAATLWQGQESPVAWIGPYGDDGKAAVLALADKQIVRYGLAAQPAADFHRLTGENLAKDYERYRDGLIDPVGCGLDVNFDGRKDLLVLSKTGGLLMVNRGFGAFLFDYDAGKPFGVSAKDAAKVPFTVGPGTLLTGGDVNADGADDVILLTEDGTLYEVRNSKPTPKE